jgi:hypothetical protein
LDFTRIIAGVCCKKTFTNEAIEVHGAQLY